MAKTEKININTDAETKERAQKLFASLGFDMTTAINVFLRRAILENGIPFPVSANLPNDVTFTALAEVEDMKKNPDKYPGYKDTKSLRSALGV